jgi:hypothetical protein
VADHLEQRADIFVPGGGDWRGALGSVTHLAIGAHPDDCEFMAFPGIEECRQGGGKFGAVVLTDGAGSVGGGHDLRAARRLEQRAAAELGGYAVAVQLDLSSEHLKNPEDQNASALLAEIFAQACPRIVYTHNPCDRHDTHVAACLRVIEALRAVPPDHQPQKVYGCEVWRDLDWLCGSDRLRLDCGTDEKFASSLNAVFRSQIEGGKRYDLAVIGRRRAQATFDDPHAADSAAMVTLAMDLTPLVADPHLSISDFALMAVDRFREDVRARLGRTAND